MDLSALATSEEVLAAGIPSEYVVVSSASLDDAVMSA